ncbi:phospholipase D-like domain-containing protein [Frateuria defendens]|uniref:phospholipase D-like domain-containing protein n=1 Tax=Frateuria defendens TaxID=2219559 RepID=UPI00066FCC3E|nr:phospholipase D family protein [Frateuria defendens]
MIPRHLPLLGLLVVIALLQGCTLDPSRIRRADALVAATVDTRSDCARADRCAIGSPLRDAADAALAASRPGAPRHVVALLSASEPALVARLNLIRAARQSIDVQTYIWDSDDAGTLVLDELLQAARRGVRVRILIDQLAAFDNVAVFDRLARANPNLQVRLYNPTFDKAVSSPLEWAAGIVCCFHRFNQRMHNKVLVVDDRVGITGGRNYQDRYFDWDDDFDYVDRDVLVGGPAARAMTASFEQFWRHPRAVPLTHLRDVNRHLLANPAAPGWPPPRYRHPERVYRAQQEADDTAWLEAHVLAQSVRTGRVDFFSDLPGKTEQPQEREDRAFTRQVMQMVAGARREVILQTPYLVMSKRARGIFRKLRRQEAPPRIVVSTNSLASTDAFAVYALSYKHRKRYIKKYGFEVYEMKPHALDPAQDNAWASMPGTGPAAEGAGAGEAASRRHVDVETRGLLGSRGSGNRPAPLLSAGRRFGLHAKSIVVDDTFAMVGSHNFDPRSDHYNTEAGVIVYDPRVADQLRAAILRETAPQNAWVIAPRRPLVPLLTDLNQAIGDLSSQLPLFDFWPYRYATSYELKDGCTPMRPSDPHFFSCYTPVGDFPDVAISPKLLYTRLITAFGAGVQGIL